MRRSFHEVWALDVQMWLIAQMKAYIMLMRNFALFCGLGHLCKGFFKESMCLLFLGHDSWWSNLVSDTCAMFSVLQQGL